MADDLFQSLDALFTKRPVERPPSLFVVNRFLAWDRGLAPSAAAISRVRDDDMAWEIWRTALPRGSGAPRLGYPAPKRPPAAEALIQEIVDRSSLSRDRVEEAVDIATEDGRLQELMDAYGVEETDD